MVIEKKTTYMIKKSGNETRAVAESIISELKENGSFRYHTEGTDYVVIKAAELIERG